MKILLVISFLSDIKEYVMNNKFDALDKNLWFRSCCSGQIIMKTKWWN